MTESNKKIKEENGVNICQLKNTIESQQNYIKKMIKSSINQPNNKRLMLGASNLGDDGVQQLITYKWTHLQELYLNSCSISYLGIRILCKGNWQYLRILNLDNNFIGLSGIKQFAKIQWASLGILTLKSNNLGFQGVRQLLKVKLPKIRTLFIGSNKLNYDSSNQLIKANWSHLRSLKISYFQDDAEDNSLGWWGCVNLSLGEWKTLSKLYIRGNCVKPSSRNLLLEILPQNWDVQMI